MMNRIGIEMSNYLRNSLIALVVLLGISVYGYAQLPEVLKRNNITFVMGGIGEDEAKAIRSEAKNWPLSIEFSEYLNNRDAWISGVQLKIINSNDEITLDEIIDGPLFLANLPVGNYQLIGTYGGVSKKQKVQIKAGKTLRVAMSWRLAKTSSTQSETKLVNVDEFNQKVTIVQENFKKMQEQMDQIHRTTDFSERQRLLGEHWATMQSNAKVMQEIWGQGLTNCCNRGGHMMDGRYLGRRGPIGSYYSEMTPEELQRHQYMLERYMGMQQNMMNQMMMHQNYRWMNR